MYSSNELKKGVIIDYQDAPHVVETTHTSSASARGGNTTYRIRLRNLKTGQRIDKNFRGGDTFSPANVEKKPIQYLYDDPEVTHFMDSESFEQFALANTDIEWERQFLIEGIEDIRAMYYNGSPIAIELPTSITLTIKETAPGVRGNSATSRSKPATLDTGYVVQVPEHMEAGIRVNIDTRTGEFLGRAKA
jgi:elongation factor P